MTEAKTTAESTESKQADAPEQDEMDKVLPATDPTRILAEKTASALSYQNLILKSYLEQEFKLNQHLKVKFRTLSSGTIEFIVRRLSKTHGNEWASIFDEALRVSYVAASLQTFNDNPIGPDLDAAMADGADAAEEALAERIAYVQKLPMVLSALLYSHYLLFTDRVDRFIKGGGAELGNS